MENSYAHFDFIIEGCPKGYADLLMSLILAFAEHIGYSLGGGFRIETEDVLIAFDSDYEKDHEQEAS
jgi:hypothetical protein